MSGDPLDPIVSSNLSDLITARLRAYIMENKMQAGDRLPSEETLAQRLGVSRTALREAMRGLEALGMVQARRGRGRVVCEFSFKPILNSLAYGLAFHTSNILQAIQIREALDLYFIDAAIRNITDDDIATLAQLVEGMKRKSALGMPIKDEDYAFHLILYRGAGNVLATELFEITWTIRLNVLYQYGILTELPPGTAVEHGAVLDAIKRRDVAAAREALQATNWNTIRLFNQFLQAEAGRDRKEVTPGRDDELDAS